MTDNEQLLGGYWFLRSLFVGSIIGFMVIKYIKSPISGGGITAYFNNDAFFRK